MELSRRNLVAVGALALGATTLIGSARAQSADEETVKKTIASLREAYLKKDKAALESLTAAQLTYSHSDGRIEDKAKFIDGVLNRKATVKSLEYPDLTVQIAGNTAIVRHLWVSESELDGKVTNTKIGVMQVLQKDGGGWKLLARSSFRFPPPPPPA
jgi:ketosteroid isomerase-like protein